MKKLSAKKNCPAHRVDNVGKNGKPINVWSWNKCIRADCSHSNDCGTRERAEAHLQ